MRLHNNKPTLIMTDEEYKAVEKFLTLCCKIDGSWGDLVDDFPYEGSAFFEALDLDAKRTHSGDYYNIEVVEC